MNLDAAAGGERSRSKACAWVLKKVFGILRKFARGGGAGAVAILSALENAHAAFVMASADATSRIKREKIVKANPFLERFTVADLKSWANRKMRVPGL